MSRHGRLQFDPAKAVAHLRAADTALAEIIARVGPCALKPLPAASLFEALLRSIVYQQLHGKAAATIHARALALLGKHGGPTAAALTHTSDDELRAAGLSRAKLAASRDLAAKCLDGTVPAWTEIPRLSDDELIERLTAVRGIGPWTVHMLLIFHLGRPDVMPTGDFAIRLAFQKLYRKRRAPKPDAILKHARRWSPYRSVASWYLWRSLELPASAPPADV
ncbi:MAG: DNA-3-methyladenine glycosylase 2 family protein [Opitutae bacterium]|nr:DNA-3-methyladenine glycosylase 2 family protein [Opitutae bacterium]